MSDGATVTVVIPTRDRWQLLAASALPSALSQEGVVFDVVVVDDGSREAPPRDLPGLQDARVLVERLPEVHGVAVARNTGIARARGDWIAFLDDDDLWSPTKLLRQLRIAQEADAGFAYTGAVWVDERLEPLRGHVPPAPDTLERELLGWNVIWGGASNVVARRDLLESLGGFDETLFQLADWDLWIRLALAASAAVVDDILVALVVHPESMLLADRRDVFIEFDRLAEKHREAATRAGVTIDRARFARWAASGHLRAGRKRAAARAYVNGSRAPGNVLRAASAFMGHSIFRTVTSARRAVPSALARGERAPDRPSWLDRYV